MSLMARVESVCVHARPESEGGRFCTDIGESCGNACGSFLSKRGQEWIARIGRSGNVLSPDTDRPHDATVSVSLASDKRVT